MADSNNNSLNKGHSENVFTCTRGQKKPNSIIERKFAGPVSVRVKSKANMRNVPGMGGMLLKLLLFNLLIWYYFRDVPMLDFVMKSDQKQLVSISNIKSEPIEEGLTNAERFARLDLEFEQIHKELDSRERIRTSVLVEYLKKEKWVLNLILLSVLDVILLLMFYIYTISK